MRVFILALVAFILSSCFYYQEKGDVQKLVDHDVRYMEDYYGNVYDAWDREDGLRMFQWKVKPLAKQPPISKEVNKAGLYIHNPLYDPLSILPPRNQHPRECLYTLGARFDDSLSAWFVEEVQMPSERCIPEDRN